MFSDKNVITLYRHYMSTWCWSLT